ncbi:hypothetical protein GY45DRAFT_1344573 [Cubamyces sp. BRFM 1775]|nr:hypothetical protein GY45DRAFT_1344573 [Cubamyces sp. BRFM 1775]
MSCVSVPTATQFSTFTTDSVSTSFSNSVSTLSPATTTIDSVVCVPTSSGNVTTSSCSTSEIVTIPITSSSATATLFSTSCSDTGNTGSPNPPSNTTTNGQESTSTVVVTTTIPTQVTFQSSFTSDGNVIVTSGTTTTFVVVTTSVPLSTGQVSSGGSTDTSAIVGGVVGGVAGAIVLSFVAWFLLRKRRHYDFDDDLFLPQPTHHDDQPKNVLRRPGEKGPSLDAEPRPYTYGALSNSSAGPSSATHTPSTENAPAFGYSRPYSPPRLPPLQAMPGQVLANAPGPMQPQPQMPPQSPPQPQPQPPQSTMSSPSAYSGTQQSSYSMPMGPPATAASASASGSTVTNTGGYDQRRPLQVVNHDYQSGSASYAPYAAGAAAGFGPGVPPLPEKAQIYLHPQTGLTAVPERAEASGSNAYFPHVMGSPPGPGSAPPPASSSAPAPASAPGPVSQPGMPYVHQDGGRVPGTGKASMAQAASAPESEAPPPAYSE